MIPEVERELLAATVKLHDLCRLVASKVPGSNPGGGDSFDKSKLKSLGTVMGPVIQVSGRRSSNRRGSCPKGQTLLQQKVWSVTSYHAIATT